MISVLLLTKTEYIYIGAAGGGGLLLFLALIALTIVVVVRCLRKKRRRQKGYKSLDEEQRFIAGGGGSGPFPRIEESVDQGWRQANKGWRIGGSSGAVVASKRRGGSFCAFVSPTSSKSSAGESASIHEYLEAKIKVPPTEHQKRAVFEDVAAMNARYYLRGSQLRLVSQLSRIGSRMYKASFMVKHPYRGNVLMTLTPKGKLCGVPINSDSGKSTFCNVLMSLKHPYIYPTYEVDYIQDRELCVVFRPFQPKGSLKDYLYKSNPKNTWDKKYRHPGRRLRLRTIAIFGRQILEGLLFLRSKGFPYGHLHSGNVILENNTCRITDYENALLNLTPRLQAFHIHLAMRQHNKQRDADLVAFGLLLFEMAMGYELTQIDPLVVPSECPDSLASVLRCIFEEHPTIKVTTLDDVLMLPLFADVLLKPHAKLKKTRIEAKGIEMLKAASKFSIVGRTEEFTDSSPTLLHRDSGSERRSRRRRRRDRLSTSVYSTSVPISTPSRRLTSAASSTYHNNMSSSYVPPPSTASFPPSSDSFSASPAMASSAPAHTFLASSSTIPFASASPPQPFPSSSSSSSRSGLLSSISAFDKADLRKPEVVNDPSAAQVSSSSS
ncbi:Slowpoke-binding protein [Balamuthia mandrillaris]